MSETRPAGFTLAELVLAFALLTLILLGSVAVFTRLLSSTGKNTSNLVGATFAQQKLEEAIATGAYANLEGAQQAYSSDATAQNYFYYRLTSRPLSGDLTSPQGNYLGGYLLEIQVWWNSAGPDAMRSGVGLQTVRQRRFFYPRVAVP